jgi:two-component system, NtrC family, response regulator GlrR
MQHTKILLIDCYPRKTIGDTLETILKSSKFKGELRREVIIDPSQVQSGWFTSHTDFNSSLIFLILPPEHLQQGGALIQSIKDLKPDLPIIVVVDECGPIETLELLRFGAGDFISPPLRAADTLARTWRLLEHAHSEKNIVRSLKERFGLKMLIGRTAGFLAEVKKIPLIARCDSRVLIAGETGTGKEMCARAIHYLSPRTGKPFVPVNCGALPVELVENELFGHESGAFTGANIAKAGLIEEAEGGTLFLDEIDCLPLTAQVKLLRFLQEKEYRRLGSAKVRHADVRVIAASNAALDVAVQNGKLRQDLYYRLNVVSIVLPPLRERREDIPVLANHFLAKYADEFDEELKTLSTEAQKRLTFYDWPGNVRELEHIIERAVMFSESSCIDEADIQLPGQGSLPEESFQEAKAKFVERFERDYIQKLLLSYNGNISRAAQSARKNRRAFWELIRKHHIDVRSFRRL